MSFAKKLSVLLAALAVSLVGLDFAFAKPVAKSKASRSKVQNRQQDRNVDEQGQRNQKNDGQRNQYDDGDRNQKNDGQRNQYDDGDRNQKNDGQRNQK